MKILSPTVNEICLPYLDFFELISLKINKGTYTLTDEKYYIIPFKSEFNKQIIEIFKIQNIQCTIDEIATYSATDYYTYFNTISIKKL